MVFILMIKPAVYSVRKPDGLLLDTTCDLYPEKV